MVMSPKPLTTSPDYAENNTIGKGIITKRKPRPVRRRQCHAEGDKITLVKLNSENEFNIKWVTARQSVIAKATVWARLAWHMKSSVICTTVLMAKAHFLNTSFQCGKTSCRPLSIICLVRAAFKKYFPYSLIRSRFKQ